MPPATYRTTHQQTALRIWLRLAEAKKIVRIGLLLSYEEQRRLSCSGVREQRRFSHATATIHHHHLKRIGVIGSLERLELALSSDERARSSRSSRLS